MERQRPVTVTAAVAACVLNALGNLATVRAPLPLMVTGLSVVAAVAGVAGAVGLWRLRGWGAIVSALVLVVSILLAAPGLPLAPNPVVRTLAAATILLDVCGMMLLALPVSGRAYA